MFFLVFFQLARTELAGFEQLFGRYLQETGPSVLWDKIKLLPEGGVSISWFL